MFSNRFLFLSLASNCMKICIQNMHNIRDKVPGHVLAEVVVSVFSFVKDSYPVNPALFEEFESNDAYDILQAALSQYVHAFLGPLITIDGELIG